MSARLERLRARLGDQRGRRVVFVSHCLLNQNVRYLGGAWCEGVVRDAIEPFVRDGIGIYQMPCPEQAAWGGVMKRLILPFYGARSVRAHALLFAGLRAHTRRVYRRLAARVAADMADYVRSGVEVVGIVGVGDSPSCGVHRTLDLRRALPIVTALDTDAIDARTFDEQVMRKCVIEGQGWFVEALRHELARRKLDVPFLEHAPSLRFDRRPV